MELGEHLLEAAAAWEKIALPRSKICGVKNIGKKRVERSISSLRRKLGLYIDITFVMQSKSKIYAPPKSVDLHISYAGTGSYTRIRMMIT